MFCGKIQQKLLYKSLFVLYNINIMFEEILKAVEEGCESGQLNIDAKKVGLMDALSLAFIGDAVHSLFVRGVLVASADFKQKDLQAKTSAVVNANNQSKTLDSIAGELTEEERAIMLRARNAHTNNKAKNSSLQDYKKSTAYEAIIGYLYLRKEFNRMNAFLRASLGN